MNISYQEKYLKYKKKYLNLRDSLKKGGTENNILSVDNLTENIVNQKDIDILLVSHNARMRCFIDTLIDIKDINNNQNLTVKNIMEYKLGQSDKKEIRFMNGAVIKLSLKKDSNEGTIELFFQGTVNNRKPGLYFTVESLSDGNIAFGKYTFDYTKSFGISQLHSNVNFYIVRHGEGTHNINKDNIILKSFNFVKGTGTDPKLTTDGENQAEEAGQKFLDHGINFTKVFVSRLERTKQTAYLILKKSGNLTINTVLIVLPCSHELNYKNSGNCDKANARIPRPPENVSNCESEDKTVINCTDCCKFNMTYFDRKSDSSDIQIEVDWSKYNKFFYQENKHCRNTNIIYEVVSYLYS
jgi:broad specificity phosphatase PhoE